MNPADRLRDDYDVFLSHNHTDKAWVRDLAERISATDWNGRPLRPWVDERFLDPGELGSEAELTSALDRSRILAVVLSPASATSNWVTFEIESFLRTRSIENVVVLRRAPCETPPALRAADALDFTEAPRFDDRFGALVDRLRPAGGPDAADAERAIDEAWDRAAAADPGGLWADPTPERDALLDALLAFDIEDAAGEGLAKTAFARAGRRLLENQRGDHPGTYNLKMLLGECLAVATMHSPRYWSAARSYLRMQPEGASDPVLAFAVVRAASKLAEFAPELLDPSILLRVSALLDSAPASGGRSSLATLVGRIAAKLRGTDLGDLLIRTLSEGGDASRFAAIGGISMGEATSPPVYYVSELAGRAAPTGAPARRTGAAEPPSRRLLAMLSGIEIDQPAELSRQLRVAREELARDFGIEEIPYGHSWFALRKLSPPPLSRSTPFLGTVARATRANMEDLAPTIETTNVVCLTESRVVEALFEHAGAFLVGEQEPASPQIRRLEGRGVPFAMLDAKRMDDLRDSDQVQVGRDTMRVVSTR